MAPHDPLHHLFFAKTAHDLSRVTNIRHEYFSAGFVGIHKEELPF
jgi:hypothetical protein